MGDKGDAKVAQVAESSAVATESAVMPVSVEGLTLSSSFFSSSVAAAALGAIGGLVVVVVVAASPTSSLATVLLGFFREAVLALAAGLRSLCCFFLF